MSIYKQLAQIGLAYYRSIATGIEPKSRLPTPVLLSDSV